MDEEVGEAQVEETSTSEEKFKEAENTHHQEDAKGEILISEVDKASDKDISGEDQQKQDSGETLETSNKATKYNRDSNKSAKEENISHERKSKQKERDHGEEAIKRDKVSKKSVSEESRSSEKGRENKDEEHSRDKARVDKDSLQNGGDQSKSVETQKKHKSHDRKTLKDDVDNTKCEQVQAFNLINPETLSKQLEVAKLDDDQTEGLLLNAKKLNAQLRKILRHQQLGEELLEAGSSPSRRPGSKSTSELHRQQEGGRSPSPSKRLVGGRGASAGRRRGSGRDILPPIHGKETTARSGHARVKSGKSHAGSEKTSFRRSARPEWNDRFIYL